VVKGPVAGAQICAFSVAVGGRGAALGSCTTTDASGKYTLTLSVASQALWLEANGGNFTDEASGAVTALPPGSPLTALVRADGGEVTSLLTPLTTLALNAARANVGATGKPDAAAYATAATQLLSSFGLPSTLNINTTLPTFGASGNDYGKALLNISRMVTNGLTLAQILATAQPSQLQAAYNAAANPPPPAAAPLVVTLATTPAWYGTLDKAQAQFEHGSSDETAGQFQSTQPYCRVAVYGLTNGGAKYYLEIPFRKDNKEVGLLKFGDDASFATLARVLKPASGVAIDTANRRISFTNLLIGTGSAGITLNGTLDYPANVAPENRAACG